MNLYEVMPVVACLNEDKHHLVFATSERQAIGMVVDLINSRQPIYHYGISDFYTNELNVDFQVPRIIG